MTDLLVTHDNHVTFLTLNRIDKHNAFDDVLIATLQQALDEAIANPEIRVIVLKSHGQHFSAGADLNWMKRMAGFSESENLTDALALANCLKTLHQSPKPTLAIVQGSAFGGGVGLIAACDIAIASNEAQFCFSEVKLGLIPAVISPYVVKAIGERLALYYFVSADVFSAARAKEMGLTHFTVEKETLETFATAKAHQIAALAPNAVKAAKVLVNQIAQHPINEQLVNLTAQTIAKIRVSQEGQHGLSAFLNKQPPQWNEK